MRPSDWAHLVVVIAGLAAFPSAIAAGPQQQATEKTTPPPWVSEETSDKQIAFDSGVVRVSGGPGWVRTRDILTDFEFRAEFRTASADTEAGIGLRAHHCKGEWPRKGYRVMLAGSAAGELTAARRPVKRLSGGSLAPLPPAEWHRVAIRALATTVTIRIDDRAESTYETDAKSGALVLFATKGQIELRNLQLASIEDESIAAADDLEKRAGFVRPVVTKEVQPSYTRAALAARVEGRLRLDAVVHEDGSVGAIRLRGYLHPHLEHEALCALLQWKFRPATLDKRPIPVRVEVEMTFTLK
jgi:TonB family protein